MKSFRITCILFLVTLLCGSNLRAQNKIYELPETDSEFSIIRNYTANVDIIYSVYLSQLVFSYVDRNTNTRRYFVSPYSVMDFRIVNDTVYFCGGGPEADVVGWFDINGVFFGGDFIHHLSIPYPLYQNLFTDTNDYSAGLEKITVIKESGYTHFVLLGNGRHKFENEYSQAYHQMIIDIYGTMQSSNWDLSYTMDYDDKFWYDDIAVTKNYVVVSGRRRGGNMDSHAIWPYTRPTPTNASQGIFESQSGYNGNSQILTEAYYSFDTTLFYPLYSVLTSALEKDKFVTVCVAKIANDVHRNTMIIEYDAPATITNKAFFKSNNFYYYRELAYNSKSDHLYMVPGIRDTLYWTASPYLSTVLTRTYGDYTWMSIDQIRGTTRNVLSGTTFETVWTQKLWWQDDNTSTGCTSNTVIINSPIEISQNTQEIDQLIFKTVLTGDRRDVRVTPKPIVVLCD